MTQTSRRAACLLQNRAAGMRQQRSTTDTHQAIICFSLSASMLTVMQTEVLERTALSAARNPKASEFSATKSSMTARFASDRAWIQNARSPYEFARSNHIQAHVGSPCHCSFSEPSFHRHRPRQQPSRVRQCNRQRRALTEC